MNTKRSTKSLSRNQTGPIDCSQGPCQPPRNSVTASPESVIRLMYSLIVKRPKRMPPYSVWYPATSSCSASGRSNGARAVSAVPASMKTTKPTNCGRTYQTSWYWASTIVDQRERLGHHHDAEHRERERHLVGDELRAGPHRAEQRVLRVGRPAADDEAVDPERADCEHEDQRDRDVGDVPVDVVGPDVPAGPRDDRERRERGERGDERGEDVEDVDGGGRERSSPCESA